MSKRKPVVWIVGYNSMIAAMYQKHGYELAATLNQADIVQFVGGADVNPKYYGETMMYRTHCNDQADVRDDHAWEHSKNKFRIGICRGGQFLNVKSGGAMFQHVDGHGLSGGVTHPIKDLIFDDSPATIEVTSTHHQMMIPGEDGEVIAFAYGIAKNHQTQSKREITPFDTEVVWYDKTNSLCFQPHPEYQASEGCTKYYFKLLNHFFN